MAPRCDAKMDDKFCSERIGKKEYNGEIIPKEDFLKMSGARVKINKKKTKGRERKKGFKKYFVCVKEY